MNDAYALLMRLFLHKVTIFLEKGVLFETEGGVWGNQLRSNFHFAPARFRKQSHPSIYPSFCILVVSETLLLAVT
jgi:hypothetical protein